MLHSYLIRELQQELHVGTQWSIYDMRGTFIAMSQYFKKVLADQCQLFNHFEGSMADDW